jgi:endothelin-converting enzyme/putative endopeptidase
MNRRLIAFAAALMATAALHAQDGTDRIKPLTSLDLTALDRSVNPCVDFYQFACGGWRKTHPIPGDKARWGRFDELAEYNRYVLKDILEEVSPSDRKGTPIERQVGDAYAACMDQTAVDRRGLAPVQPYLDAVSSGATKADLARALGSLRRDGVTGLFTFAVGPDFKDASATLMGVDQGGITMPDRDFYLKDDPKNTETRAKYVAYVETVLRLAGDTPADAAKHAAAVLAFETRLARAQLDRTARRDPKNRDHRMTRDDLKALTPSFDFDAYFTSAQAPDFRDVNVGWPDFFKTLDATWQGTSIEDAKTYARWRILNEAAPVLAAPFEKANFEFFSGYLRGIKEQPPRWKTCVAAVDGSLGEALGQLYVARTFGADGKARMRTLVDALTTALEQDIQTLDWMTPATKAKAIEKLKKLGKSKIGYPDKWRDYSTVRITRDDFAGNTFRAEAFEVKRNYDKLGKPVDKNDWGMTPPTVNAYYSPQLAEIVFPAGILQPPFFNREADEAVNFGGIGSVIGHELSHGFDDSGRKFDGDGNLADWWTDADGKAFEARASCIADQYSGYSPVADPKTSEPAHINGRLTLGENIGDNGGVRISYMALKNTLAGRDTAPRDGFTPEQRFFLGYAQVWCQNSTDADALQRLVTDPHSPGRFRTNGVLANMPEFQKAFSCTPPAAMIAEQRCRVW